jgi:hypothetical protein
MVQAKVPSDFVLTGCAIVPAIGLGFGQPEFALLAHIVLLFAGILAAGTESDAPCKQAGLRSDLKSEAPARAINLPRTTTPPRGDVRLTMPLERHADDASSTTHGPNTRSKLG